MDHDGSMSRMLRMCEWVMRLAYTNLLWLLFTLLGLGIFGFMPATTALFSVMRKWIQGHEQVSVFQTFWKVYREEFVRSNVIGVVLVIIGTIIYVDLAYIYPTSWFLHVLRFAIYIFGFLFIVSLFYIFPLLAHYDWKKRLYLKFSFCLASRICNIRSLCSFSRLFSLSYLLICQGSCRFLASAFSHMATCG